jgi:hypothetical protein
MLTPLTSPRTNSPKLATKLSAPPSPPPLADTFERTTTEHLPVMKDALSLFGQQDSNKVKLGKAIGYTLALGLGLAGGMMVGSADAGQAAMVQQTAVSKALTNSKARSLLQRLPAEFGNKARGMSDAQMRVLKGGMTGDTKVGPITVNNRKAFIRGHVVGKSVWPEVTKQIKEARSKHGMITSSEERELHQVIDQVSRMSKSQRETVANLMDYIKS